MAEYSRSRSGQSPCLRRGRESNRCSAQCSFPDIHFRRFGQKGLFAGLFPDALKGGGSAALPAGELNAEEDWGRTG